MGVKRSRKPKVVTAALLKEHGACPSYVTKFRALFPGGLQLPKKSSDIGCLCTMLWNEFDVKWFLARFELTVDVWDPEYMRWRRVRRGRFICGAPYLDMLDAEERRGIK